MLTLNADEIKDALEKIVDGNLDALIRDTTRIIGFETVSGGTPAQEARYQEQIPACLAWLEALATRHGFRFQNFENESAEIEWAIEPQPGEGRRCVFGIATHIDVVTPAGNWSHPPFGGEVVDGILYGRGIQDDKGPLMQAFYGLVAVKEAGIRPPCDVRIIIGTKEETGDWSDIHNYVKRRGAPDYSFTPDADFPVITGEKGMINVIVSAKWPAVAPNAETGMLFMSLRGGERSNIVPALAEAALRFPAENRHDVMKELVRETTVFTVENHGSNVTLVPNNEKDLATTGVYEALVSFVGKAAHSSTPSAGHNAIADAMKFFADIESIPPTVRAYIQFLALASAETDGSTLGIASTHPFVGDTTAVVSLAEVGPEGGKATLNIRPTMGLPAAEALERVRAVAAAFTDATGLELEVSPGPKMVDAIFLDPNREGIGPFLESLKTAYSTVTGLPGRMMAVGGTTYAKAIPNCCAFGPVLDGVDKELAHQANEHLAVSSIRRNALIYGLSVALMGRNVG